MRCKPLRKKIRGSRISFRKRSRLSNPKRRKLVQKTNFMRL